MLSHVFLIYIFDYSLKFNFFSLLAISIYHVCIYIFIFSAARIYLMYWIIRIYYMLRILTMYAKHE